MEAAKAGGRGWGVWDVTEDEGLKIQRTFRLLEHIREHTSLRKLRLAGSAFARWHQAMPACADVKQCAETIEEVADSPTRWNELWDSLFSLPGESWALAHVLESEDCVYVGKALARMLQYTSANMVIANEILGQIINDIFGNPFRPVVFDPRLRTSDVVGLARTIYDDKAFERMPILADALMDAGCEDEQVIAHCRGPGPHVRGCWVVDLILGTG